jgi:hypothetical protein
MKYLNTHISMRIKDTVRRSICPIKTDLTYSGTNVLVEQANSHKNLAIIFI